MEGRGQSARVVPLSRGLRACGVHSAEQEATSWMPTVPIDHRPAHSPIYAMHTLSYLVHVVYSIHTVDMAHTLFNMTCHLHAVDMNARRGFITVRIRSTPRIWQKYKVAGRKRGFFKILNNLIKNKEYISIQTLDRKQVPPQVPRTWQRGHGCAGCGTTGLPLSASESSAGEVVAPA